MTHSFPTRRSSDLPGAARSQPAARRGICQLRTGVPRSGAGVRRAPPDAAPRNAALRAGPSASRRLSHATTCRDPFRAARRPGGGGRRPRRHRPRLRRLQAERAAGRLRPGGGARDQHRRRQGSEEHTSELQSLMRISYAVFCLKKKKNKTIDTLNIEATNSKKKIQIKKKK